jgi:hypothetical protein
MLCVERIKLFRVWSNNGFLKNGYSGSKKQDFLEQLDEYRLLKVTAPFN